MRRTLIILSVFMALLVTARSLKDYRMMLKVAQSASWSPSSIASMTGWWRGEGNANDELGLNNGTEHGSITYTTGLIGQCFSTPGSSYIDIGAVQLCNTISNMTVCAWVKPFSASAYPRSIVCNGLFSGSTYGFGIYSETDYKCQFRQTYRTAIAADSYDYADWHFIVGIMRGNYAEIWVDGILADSTLYTQQDSYELPNGRWGIGANYATSWGSYYQGLVDEVMIFDEALTETQIQQIYQWREE